MLDHYELATFTQMIAHHSVSLLLFENPLNGLLLIKG